MFKTSVLTAALFGVTTASSVNAGLLIDEDFQASTGLSNNTSVGAAFTGWTPSNGNAKFVNESSADLPGDQDFVGTNQAIKFEYTNATLTKATGHSWSSSDVFTLTFNASPQAWEIDNQRWVRPQIIQTSDNTVLWDPGETSESALFWHNEAVDGANPYSWNGSGPFGNSDWQSEPDTQYSFTINASDFTGGTEGETISLVLASSGQRGMYYDNVELTVVPEPGSLALLGLGGLLIGYRRRRG